MRILAILVLALAPFPLIAQEEAELQLPETLRYVPTDTILWPDEGYFYAYPVDTTELRNLKFSGTVGLVFDDNVFRLDDDESPEALLGESGRSDTIRQVGVGVRYDLPVSRQTFTFEGRADNYEYNRFDDLSHTAYLFGGNWNYQAGPDLSGDLGYRRTQRLTSFTEQQSQRDLITRDRAYLTGNYRIFPRLQVRGGLAGDRIDHSNDDRRALDQRIATQIVGVDYVSIRENTLGVQLQLKQGSFPNREVVTTGSAIDNEYDEYEISAVTGWQFAPKTRFDGRLGYTDREHDEVSERDFSGITYRGTLAWAPFPKILVDGALYREIASVEDLIASFVLTEGFSAGIAWAPTIKIVLQARAIYEDRKYEGDPGSSAARDRDDEFTGLRLTAGYRPTRVIDVTGSYENGRRSSNLNNADYDYDLFSINVGIRIQ